VFQSSEVVKAPSWCWLIYIYKIDIFPPHGASIINWQSLKSSKNTPSTGRGATSLHGRSERFGLIETQFVWQLPVAWPKLAAFSLVILIEWQTHGTKKKNPLIFCRQFGGQPPRQSHFFPTIRFFTLCFGVDIMGIRGGVGEIALLQMIYGMMLLMTSLPDPRVHWKKKSVLRSTIF